MKFAGQADIMDSMSYLLVAGCRSARSGDSGSAQIQYGNGHMSGPEWSSMCRSRRCGRFVDVARGGDAEVSRGDLMGVAALVFLYCTATSTNAGR